MPAKRHKRHTSQKENPFSNVMQEFKLTDTGMGTGMIEGRLKITSQGIEVFFDGYGVKTMEPGHGSPIYIEYHDGLPVVHIWGNINEEDTTNSVDISGAAEVNREPEGDQGRCRGCKSWCGVPGCDICKGHRLCQSCINNGLVISAVEAGNE